MMFVEKSRAVPGLERAKATAKQNHEKNHCGSEVSRSRPSIFEESIAAEKRSVIENGIPAGEGGSRKCSEERK